MGTSLKDALLKAGFKKTPKQEVVREKRPPPAKNQNVNASSNHPTANKTSFVNKNKSTPNPNPTSNPAPKPKSESFQEQHNFCEVCQRISPDVECYDHRVPTIDARWICLPCADIHQISDELRRSAQSDVAKRGMFKRQFGRTLRYVDQANRSAQGPSGHHRDGHHNNHQGGYRNDARDNRQRYQPNDRRENPNPSANKYGVNPQRQEHSYHDRQQNDSKATTSAKNIETNGSHEKNNPEKN